MPSANALLAAARSAQTLELPVRAARLYRLVIERYPASPEAGAAEVALGRLLLGELAQPRAALRAFDRYLRGHPGGALAEEPLYYRALSLERLGQEHEARAAFRQLATSFPDSLYATGARARLGRERDD